VVWSTRLFRSGAREEVPLYQSGNKPKRRAGFGSTAWGDPVDEEDLRAHSQIDPWVRAAFIRKVYAILSSQLIVTTGLAVGVIYMCFYHGDPNMLTSTGAWLIYGPGYFLNFVGLIVGLIILCCLMSCKDSYPLNFVGLWLFTLCFGWQIASICALYYGEGFGDDLMLAFVITTSTFLVLTVFTIVSKIDFTFLGPYLCLGGIILVLWSLIMSLAFCFGGFSADWTLAFSIVGMLFFIGFIIFDTYMIVTRFGVDDYIIAAIELYLDVINLFLCVLQCLTLCGSR